MNVGTGRAIVATMITAFAAATCQAGPPSEGGNSESTITLAEAARKVETYAEQARMALGSDVKFIKPYRNYDFPCSNADGSPSQNRHDARVDYQLAEVAPEQIPVFFQKIRAYWEKAGFSITDDDQKGPFLGAKNTVDGFMMGLQANNSKKST